MAAPNDQIGSDNNHWENRLKEATSQRDGRRIAKTLRMAQSPVLPMAVYGAWAINGDGAYTNGAGLVGATAKLTVLAADYCKVLDDTAYENLEDSDDGAGYTAAFQMFPDTPVAETDYFLMGFDRPVAEIAFNTATPAVYNSTAVLEWFYGDDASDPTSWAALTVAFDNSEANAQDGTESWERDGAVLFVPPTDWARTTIDGVTAYWIRVGIAAGKAANMTTVPILADEPAVVTATDPFIAPAPGQIVGIRASSGAAALGSTADTKFVLVNTTTGDHSGELTWTTALRTDAWTGLNLAVNDGDELAVYVTQEDGTAEHDTVLFELEYANPQDPG